MSKPAEPKKQPPKYPYLWNPVQAWDFPTIFDSIKRNNIRSNMPNEMIAVIFFEESAFCNITQDGKDGPATGFGQIELGNRTKFDFYRWLNDPEFPISDELMAGLKKIVLDVPTINAKRAVVEKIKTKMLGSKEFSVQMTCKYFEFLSSPAGGNKQVEGLIGAQISSHTEYKNRFTNGYNALRAAMNLTGVGPEKVRDAFVAALNVARMRGKGEALTTKSNPILREGNYGYPEFWDWILPPSWIAHRSGLMAAGQNPDTPTLQVAM